MTVESRALRGFRLGAPVLVLLVWAQLAGAQPTEKMPLRADEVIDRAT